MPVLPQKPDVGELGEAAELVDFVVQLLDALSIEKSIFG